MDLITKGFEPNKLEYRDKQILKALRDSQLELESHRKEHIRCGDSYRSSLEESYNYKSYAEARC